MKSLIEKSALLRDWSRVRFGLAYLGTLFVLASCAAPALAQFVPGVYRTYTMLSQYNGTIPVSTDILRMVISTPIICPSALTGSRGQSITAPTANTVFPIKKNGVSQGTLQYNAGLTTITLSFAAAVSFNAGDLIQITSPASADATLADITFTLVCYRQT